jgi:hypothetical protein
MAAAHRIVLMGGLVARGRPTDAPIPPHERIVEDTLVVFMKLSLSSLSNRYTVG